MKRYKLEAKLEKFIQTPEDIDEVLIIMSSVAAIKSNSTHSADDRDEFDRKSRALSEASRKSLR